MQAFPREDSNQGGVRGLWGDELFRGPLVPFCWHELVERYYPKCHIIRVVSVRGSTGCWFYKQPGKINKYVLHSGRI